MICFHCKKNITQNGDDVPMFIPIERPVYGNLIVHKFGCLPEVMKDLVGYLTEHWEEILEFWGKSPVEKVSDKPTKMVKPEKVKTTKRKLAGTTKKRKK